MLGVRHCFRSWNTVIKTYKFPMEPILDLVGVVGYEQFRCQKEIEDGDVLPNEERGLIVAG